MDFGTVTAFWFEQCLGAVILSTVQPSKNRQSHPCEQRSEDLHLAQWPIKNMILRYSHILQELKELKNLGAITGDLAEILPCRRRAENSY